MSCKNIRPAGEIPKWVWVVGGILFAIYFVFMVTAINLSSKREVPAQGMSQGQVMETSIHDGDTIEIAKRCQPGLSIK